MRASASDAHDTAYGGAMRTTATSRGPSVALALLLSALPLAACSSTSTGPYCDAVTAAEADWKNVGQALEDPARAARVATTITQIEANAPEEVKADWASLRVLVEKFTVADADLTALTTQMQGFESSARRVETHARETCGVDLGS